MSIIIVHDALEKALTAAADAPLEVCSSDGRLLGYFTPAKERKLNLDPGISDVEIERRFAAGAADRWPTFSATWRSGRELLGDLVADAENELAAIWMASSDSECRYESVGRTRSAVGGEWPE